MKKHQTIWLVLAFALVLRLPLLNGSFWLDEAAQALESVRPFSQQLDIIPDFQPPLLHYIVHFASYAGRAEWWLRLWGALIPGLVTIWATYQLGKKWFNERVALTASLLLATSSFHIFYSQELRPYSLPAMWAILSLLVLFAKKFEWWKFALITVLGLYSSYLYPFFLLPQLWFLWHNKKGKEALMKIGAVIVVLFGPWLPLFFRQLQAGQLLRTELPGWETVVSTPQLKALALVPLKFVYGVLNIEATPLFALLSLACVAAFAISYRPIFQKKLPKPLLSLLIFLFAPLVSSWLVSFFVPVVQPKRLLFLLPLFSLLVAFPLAGKKLARTAWLLPAIILLINLFSTVSYWTHPELQREDWRGLKTELIRKFPTPDAISVFAFDEPFAPWRWYWPESIPSLAVGKRHAQDVEDVATVLKPLTEYEYVLIFDYLRTLTDPENMLETAVEDFGYQSRGVIDRPGIGFVRIYSKPDVAVSYRP